MRHILVKTKAQANKIYDQLKAGGELRGPREEVLDGSGLEGQRRQAHDHPRARPSPPFDTTAFLLSTNQISRPVKTQYGYHVIQPISAIKPAKTTPLKDAKPAIQATLLDKAKTDAITKWTNDTKASSPRRSTYATGFAPPAAGDRHVGDDNRLTCGAAGG